MGARVHGRWYVLACPHCAAAKGEPCRHLGGGYQAPHLARRLLVEQAEATSQGGAEHLPTAAPGRCVGGCGRYGSNPNRLGCEYCWNRLPLHLRRAKRGCRRLGRDSPAYRGAVAAVLAWYHAHPSPVLVGEAADA